MTLLKLASLKTIAEFRERLDQLALQLDVDDGLISGPTAPLGQSTLAHGRRIGNRFAILPMEGWDANPDGSPTDLVRRRWKRFGQSGAKLIWGGEAVAVRPDGRANPHQLVLDASTESSIAELRQVLTQEHASHHGNADDLFIGLQLTHSGRFARPNDKKRLEPRTAYSHPLLDARFGITDNRVVFTDLELGTLVEDFVRAAVRAQNAGFDFVDIKHCHGYLGHELLTAIDRPGRYGGSLTNRMQFVREIIQGIRRDAPGLEVGVRLSLFDQLPYEKGADGVGTPMRWIGPYPYAFGADPNHPATIDLREPIQFLRELGRLGVQLICLTAGSPYYNPHIQRPAMQPPSDGYQPPEDPLVGVARHLHAVAEVKRQLPELLLVGSGYSYLQEWLPNVAQAAVRLGHVDFIGLGRMVLSYPELPVDVLAGKPMQRRKICRTFSDCTTAPRNGLVSGCFPLDDFYKTHPDAAVLKAIRASS